MPSFEEALAEIKKTERKSMSFSDAMALINNEKGATTPVAPSRKAPFSLTENAEPSASFIGDFVMPSLNDTTSEASLWGDFIKPTLKTLRRVPDAIAASLIPSYMRDPALEEYGPAMGEGGSSGPADLWNPAETAEQLKGMFIDMPIQAGKDVISGDVATKPETALMTLMLAGGLAKGFKHPVERVNDVIMEPSGITTTPPPIATREIVKRERPLRVKPAETFEAYKATQDAKIKVKSNKVGADAVTAEQKKQYDTEVKAWNEAQSDANAIEVKPTYEEAVKAFNIEEAKAARDVTTELPPDTMINSITKAELGDLATEKPVEAAKHVDEGIKSGIPIADEESAALNEINNKAMDLQSMDNPPANVETLLDNLDVAAEEVKTVIAKAREEKKNEKRLEDVQQEGNVPRGEEGVNAGEGVQGEGRMGNANAGKEKGLLVEPEIIAPKENLQVRPIPKVYEDSVPRVDENGFPIPSQTAEQAAAVKEMPKVGYRAINELEAELTVLRNQHSSADMYGRREIIKEIRAKEKEILDAERAHNGGRKENITDILDILDSVDMQERKPGPGAQNVVDGVPLSPEQSGDALGTITEHLKASISTMGKADKVTVKQAAMRRYNAGKDAVTSTINNMKAATANAMTALQEPNLSYKEMLGEFQYVQSDTGLTTARFNETMVKEFSLPRREAMAKWYTTGGDMALLEKYAHESTNPRLRKMYADAMTLTEKEKHVAANLLQYHEAILENAHANGVDIPGVENYLRRSWSKPGQNSKLFKNFISELNSGIFNANPKFLRKRIFETEFEAEQLGYTLKSYDIIERTAGYNIDFNTMLATRKFVTDAFNAKASDGRPMVVTQGSGSKVTNADGTTTVFVKAHTKPENAYDYRPIDNAAFKKHKFTVADENGNVVFVQGDALVHPEYYTRFKNLVTPSAIQTATIRTPGLWAVKQLLKVSSFVKGTMFSLSLFHQVHVGSHAIFHWSSPFAVKPIDLTAETSIAGVRGFHQANLTRNGLVVYAGRAMEQFSEGLHGAGLINKLPVVGPLSMRYSSYVFGDYIPRLKMNTAMEMLGRNLERYNGKLTKQEIYERTAHQANAAFGELNGDWMGRSKTTQDVFRLIGLAPDFLEARIRFVTQSVRFKVLDADQMPVTTSRLSGIKDKIFTIKGKRLQYVGHEQAIALVRGALLMGLTAKFIEAIINGETPKRDDLEHPFAVRVDKTRYGIRSVHADFLHLVENPQGFTMNRANPMVRMIDDILRERNQWGQKKTALETLEDQAKGTMPLPAQSVLKSRKNEKEWMNSLVDGALSMVGITITEIREEKKGRTRRKRRSR